MILCGSNSPEFIIRGRCFGENGTLDSLPEQFCAPVQMHRERLHQTVATGGGRNGNTGRLECANRDLWEDFSGIFLYLSFDVDLLLRLVLEEEMLLRRGEA